MAHLLEDLPKYKALVLSGVPKLITGEAFAEGEEEAVFEFVDCHGLPVPICTFRMTFSNLASATPNRSDVGNSLIEVLKEGITNVFSGKYGI